MDVFRKGKFKLLALTETKWCGVNGIIAGVQEMERVREGVAFLYNDALALDSCGLSSSSKG